VKYLLIFLAFISTAIAGVVDNSGQVIKSGTYQSPTFTGTSVALGNFVFNGAVSGAGFSTAAANAALSGTQFEAAITSTQAEIWDDFSLHPSGPITTGSYTDGGVGMTTVASGTTQTGQTYVLGGAAGGPFPNPSVSASTLQAVPASTYYMSVTGTNVVYNWGAKISWTTGTGAAGNSEGFVLISGSQGQLPNSFLHITWNRIEYQIQLTNSNVAGLTTLAQGIAQVSPDDDGAEYVMEVTVMGDTLVCNFGGQVVTVTDSRVHTCTGQMAMWEKATLGTFCADNVRLHEVWVNRPWTRRDIGRSVQGWSNRLDSLSDGSIKALYGFIGDPLNNVGRGSNGTGWLDVDNGVTTNTGIYTGQSPRNGLPSNGVLGAWIEGIPNNSTVATSGTTEQDICDDGFNKSAFQSVSDTDELVIYGDFASNSNTKRVRATLAGTTIIDSGTSAFQGPWELHVRVVAKTLDSGSYHCRVLCKLFINGQPVICQTAPDYYFFANFALALYGTGGAASDVQRTEVIHYWSER